MSIFALALILTMLTACTPKEPAVSLPDAQPVPLSSAEEMATFQAPSLYVPPSDPLPVPVFPSSSARPPSANEKRYAWRDGESYLVQVQVGYPTVVRLHPTEKISSVVDGDRAPLTEEETATKTQPQQEKHAQCSWGVRWQFCRGISESQYAPIESIAFSASQTGHRSGFVVFTTQRTYALDLHAVAQTKVRLVTFETPGSPFIPPPPPAPTLLPTGPHQFHVGYTMTSGGALPQWAPVQILSDLPTESSSKMYLRFPPFVMHTRMPLLRGMTEQGKPYLLNARQYGEWVIVDELAPRLELRQGAGEDAVRVIISRGPLRTIHCPGDALCPIWPRTYVSATP